MPCARIATRPALRSSPHRLSRVTPGMLRQRELSCQRSACCWRFTSATVMTVAAALLVLRSMLNDFHKHR